MFRNLLTIFIIAFAIFLYSCEKEEIPTVDATTTNTANFDADTTITHIIEDDRIKQVDGNLGLRVGIKSDYFYNQSWTTRNTLTQTTNGIIQTVFNKNVVDSFTFVRAQPVVVHLIGTGLLSVYRVQGFNGGELIYDAEHLALLKGETYTELPVGTNDLATNSPLLSIKYTRLVSTVQSYFDFECGITKNRYEYLIVLNQDPTTQTQAVINAQTCNVPTYFLTHKWI